FLKCLGLKQLKASYIKLLAQISNSNQVFSKLASLEQPLFNDWLRGWEVGCAFQAALESTVIKISAMLRTYTGVGYYLICLPVLTSTSRPRVLGRGRQPHWLINESSARSEESGYICVASRINIIIDKPVRLKTVVPLRGPARRARIHLYKCKLKDRKSVVLGKSVDLVC